ncbi:MAG: PIN domain-containing protein [Egibacteraceae bacterium]
MSSYVLDASAVLAFERDEPGADVVGAALAGAVISTVTLAEVLFRYGREGVERRSLASDLERLGVRIEPFTVEDAYLQVLMHSVDSQRSLSLGDRCCLAVALRLGLEALTADRYWAELGPAVRVRLIR